MKKAMSTFGTMFSLLLCSSTVSANVIGDINGDGVVGLPEALFSLQVAAGLHPGFPETCVLTGAGIWQTGVNYQECDVVSLGDDFYVALVANTSGASNSPDVDPATWAQLPLEGQPASIPGTDKQFIYNDNGSGAGTEMYFDKSTNMVGIGTSSPEFKLTLDNDGGIIARGSFESGATLATSGKGARLIWYPRKAAFRAGYAGETSWDDVNIGDRSAAMGWYTTASGRSSFALGNQTTASGTASTAMGSGTYADDFASTAMGWFSAATGWISVAMGNNSRAAGDMSIAMGLNNEANGDISIAMGQKTAAIGKNSIVIGKGYDNADLENDQPESFMVGFMNSSNDTEPEFFVRDGAVGIGTSNPAVLLDLNSTNDASELPGSGVLQIGGELRLDNNEIITNANTPLYLQRTNNGDLIVDNGTLKVEAETDRVGIGTAAPGNMLDVAGAGTVLGGAALYPEVVARFRNTEAANHSAISIDSLSGRDAILYFAREGARVWSLRNDESTGDNFELRYSGARVLTADTSGNVGIGTHTPAGKLDVNGAIFQRGSSLHADYVFEPDYDLESIEEHAAFMWRQKHLKAVPGVQYDENGREVLEMGAHRRGILEELEKAHIYIAELNDTIKSQQKMIAGLQAVVCRIQPEAEICGK